MTNPAHRSIDVGTVLTNVEGERFIVTDIFCNRLKLCRVPADMEPKEFGVRFRHSPVFDDPTRATLVGADVDD